MGDLLRSKEVNLATLSIPTESAYEVVSALGDLGMVHFLDLNEDVNAFQRKYVNEVKRCDEMQRKLRFFEKECNDQKLKVNGAEAAALKPAPEYKEISAMEAKFTRLEEELREIKSNEDKLNRQKLELNELRSILQKTVHFFEEAEEATNVSVQQERSYDNTDSPLLAEQQSSRAGQLNFITGVIPRENVVGFERFLWRACRGNVFLRRVPIDEALKDPTKQIEVHKEVFIAFFQGEQLEKRVRRICEGYDATVYPCPPTASARRELLMGVESRIAEMQGVLNQTHEHRLATLNNISFELGEWIVQATKVKAIFDVMNMFTSGNKIVQAECWYPADKLSEIQDALNLGIQRSQSQGHCVFVDRPTKQKPPTYHRTNKFTGGFQAIIDAYGVASYREINPGPFTIITFPFLFAVMFGDLGHGFIMACAAGAMILKEKSLLKFKDGGEIWDTMFSGRYLIFLMGLFSMYTGFIYNDCFSKSITLGSSGWDVPTSKWPSPDTINTTIIELEPPAHHDSDFSFPYVFGIDPIWLSTENRLTFTNSYKMKLSIILGIMQMEFGVIVSLLNNLFFKDRLKIIGEFIPQVLFLTCIFGYLVIMIIYKWCLLSFPNKPNNPPSLLLMLINMFLQFGAAPDEGEVLYGDEAGHAQQYIQMILVIVAVICVPWMLLLRPCVIRRRMKQHAEHAQHASFMGQADEDELIVEEDEGDDEEHSFSEIMVHQAIHTIEFCLGCISNTASYLRLWALSLAHSQLSDVLWTMVLHMGFSQWYIMYLAFAVWAVLTIAVLLIMEGLSAFLHALRLHWVEFQNKFYDGNGYKFQPFSFQRVLDGEEDES